MDTRHIALVKNQSGWYAVRELQQSDLSAIHLDPPPKNLAKRILFKDRWMAGDKIIAPLAASDIEQFDLSKEDAARINSEINL